MKPLYYSIVALVLLSCKQGETLLFEADFNTDRLNEVHWNYELGDGCPNLCGWGNNERQIYTRENVQLRDGKLVIKATRDSTLYRSGRITTKKKVEFQYGTVEVRAKLPVGRGLWPAIWMLGNDIDTNTWPACGEIDIMEYVGKEPHTIYTSLHTPDSYGNTVNSKKTINENIEEGFHVYKTHWTKDAITFYIDEKPVYTFSPEVKNEKTWPFNKPFYIILNLAIGGNFGGPEVDDSIFPAEFIIDYVKVFQ
ncbi:MAG: glycoside hydrolase family 16 protein [Bacteroidota bacterium]